MQALNFDPLIAAISDIPKSARDGSLNEIKSNTVLIRGISKVARIGDLVSIYPRNGKPIFGEVIVLHGEQVEVLSEKGTSGLGLNDRVRHLGTSSVRPDKSWLGRLLDPFLEPLDGEPLLQGKTELELRASPPPAVERNRLGERLETGLVVLDAMLPLVRGQRLGLFAGSGVGKSTLLADIAKGTEADVAVIVLVGERGREVREFVEDTLGPEGLAKSVVIAATSDQSPTARRRAAWAGLAVAEYFRDQGKHVLLLMDSLTRFAEAHREIATSCGEAASLRGFPPSTTQAITSLCERAGPGPAGKGDITAVFSVLVAGSDFDEPVADITRGVLDGHILLAREIAERGRFPAIDVLKSVSRSLPKAANDDENALIAEAKRAMSKYEESEALVQSGLYKPGSDPELDRALLMRPKLEVLFSKKEIRPISEGYELMKSILESTPE